MLFYYQVVPPIRVLESGPICRNDWRPLVTVGLTSDSQQAWRGLPAGSPACHLVCLIGSLCRLVSAGAMLPVLSNYHLCS